MFEIYITYKKKDYIIKKNLLRHAPDKLVTVLSWFDCKFNIKFL
jgi:hypothetical protein